MIKQKYLFSIFVSKIDETKAKNRISKKKKKGFSISFFYFILVQYLRFPLQKVILFYKVILVFSIEFLFILLILVFIVLNNNIKQLISIQKSVTPIFKALHFLYLPTFSTIRSDML